MKKVSILALLMCLLLVASLFVACKPKDIKEWESNPVVASDSPLYRDYYHIFVYGFADGNGDGIGDLNGIESKLDYIAGLGFNGIWLSPVHPSSQSAHKYDVEDYCAIDSDYGTLDDFKSLVDAAHAKGISVMMDMVFNHSSNRHPWFKAAQQAYADGDTSNKYYDYYTFRTGPNDYLTFEGVQTMPKLNMESESVREEIDNICKFWLQDYGVDAFRLDAAKYFYGNAGGNIPFFQWLMSTAQKYNPDVYMVAEVWEHDTVVYKHYAEDSVQSFFNFELSGTNGYNKLMVYVNDGYIDKASMFENVIKTKEEGTAKGIDALFASNHDTSRVSNSPLSYYSNREGEVTTSMMERHKMGIAMLYTQSGNVFSYYGNEIGLRNGVRFDSSSSYLDCTYRIAMNWGNKCEVTHEDGFAYQSYGYSTRYGQYEDFLGGVAEQVDDQNSIYNFYRRIMLLRRQNPEIAQGVSSFVVYDDADVAVIKRTYNDKSILLVYNLNSSQTKTVDLTKIVKEHNLQGTLAGFLSSDNSRDVKLKGAKLELPQFSIAVIR